MLDIGWTELVVIAIVLIIVVGPKDLPPMLRTFGKMMTKMRGMATDFRHQFDEALKEADLDDVRQTLADAQRLNPAHTLREAMSPLRQMGNELKADLHKAANPDPKPVEAKLAETATDVSQTPVAQPEVAAAATLPVTQPTAVEAEPAPMVSAVSPDAPKAKAKRIPKPKIAEPSPVEAIDAGVEVTAAKPKRAPRKPAAVTDGVEVPVVLPPKRAARAKTKKGDA